MMSNAISIPNCIGIDGYRFTTSKEMILVAFVTNVVWLRSSIFSRNVVQLSMCAGMYFKLWVIIFSNSQSNLSTLVPCTLALGLIVNERVGLFMVFDADEKSCSVGV